MNFADFVVRQREAEARIAEAGNWKERALAAEAKLPLLSPPLVSAWRPDREELRKRTLMSLRGVAKHPRMGGMFTVRESIIHDVIDLLALVPPVGDDHNQTHTPASAGSGEVKD